jgi:hypothetical protein
MAIDPNIALGFRGVELPNQLAQYAQITQIQNAQQANRLHEMQMAEYARTRSEEEGARNFLGKADLADPAVRAQLQSQFGKTGRDIYKNFNEAEASQAQTMSHRATAAQKKQDMIGQAYRDISSRPDDENIISHTRDILSSPFYDANEKAAVQARADQLLKMPADQRQSFLASQGAKAGDLKPTVQSVNQYGQTQLVRVPAFNGAPTSVGTYADVPLPADVQAQKLQTAKAGASNITMSTEKKYGEAFGTKIADVDISKMTTAEKAPQMAENANRIIDLVKQGNVFTGPAADVKLNIARVLNVAGASNDEKIANTESLIAGTGQSTLDAIKGAGLGTGQGFTDKDLRFLQGIAGGTIGLTPKTLTDLAELQHRVAVRSAEAWNKRSGEMPKEVIQGTGLNTTPIKVPPLSSGATKAAARPAGVGANWTFERDNAGNTAWVSPDRKSFKEAQ